MVILCPLSCTANVHRICEEFQIHLSQCPAHDQFHAAHTDRDVCCGHTHLLPACLHLHPSACHPLAQCDDDKEEGRYPSAWKECTLLWGGMCGERENYSSPFRLLVMSLKCQYLSDPFHNVLSNFLPGAGSFGDHPVVACVSLEFHQGIRKDNCGVEVTFLSPTCKSLRCMFHLLPWAPFFHSVKLLFAASVAKPLGKED